MFAERCAELVKSYLPLCPLDYHQLVSGKTSEVELKDGVGTAKFNPKTQVVDYPAAVPKNRLPVKSNRPQKALALRGAMVRTPVRGALLGQSASEIRADEGGSSSFVTFYIDSGAGQCLSSCCSSAFITMEACHLQVIGVAGRLTIHGHGTTLFLVSVDGQEALLQVHNCLQSFGEFNSISVSQLKLVPGNSVDFSVEKPFLRFSGAQSQSPDQPFFDFMEVPLCMDDGLYSLSLEPVSPSDPRYGTLPVFDVTPQGPFVQLSHMLRAVPGPADLPHPPVWTTEILSVPSLVGRVMALNSSLDFDDELRVFSDAFLAPAAIPPARRQYDTEKVLDMTELSIRFMGAGTAQIMIWLFTESKLCFWMKGCTFITRIH
jgi:hypothetical protein